MKALRRVDSQSMYYQSQYKHPLVRIAIGHNSHNTDPSAPIFVANMYCVMAQVWCKLYQNWTKGIENISTKILIC